MPEYRPVPDEEEDAFRRVLDYAFRAEAGPGPEPLGDAEASPDAVIERRGIYEDGALVTTGAHHRVEFRVRGRWVASTGLGGVATLPEARHRGLVRELLRDSLEEYREWGRPVSVLWPFKHAFYRRFGWGRIGPLGKHEVDPAAFGAVRDHPLARGGFEALELDDVEAMRGVDDRIAESRDFTMRRTDDWYRHRFFAGWEGDPFVYGWRRDGELGGYLRYSVEEEDDEHVLQVTDLAAPDDAALVNLLRFLDVHEAQVKRLRLYAAPDDRLFDLAEDPRDVHLEVRPGPMARLVDVVAGLEALAAPEGVDATLTLAVEDRLADWNDGTFGVGAEDGSFRVDPEPNGSTDATLPIETLSRLAFGTVSAERAALAGGLVADRGTLEALDALFPPRETYLREFF